MLLDKNLRIYGVALPVIFTVSLLLAATSAGAQTYTVLHNFRGAKSDGSRPSGDLIQDATGTFYGTTSGGGNATAGGTVFTLDPTGNEAILYTPGQTGSEPWAGLFRDPDGNFYGTAYNGGSYGQGTVFKLDTNNVATTLHSFKGGTDGAHPNSRLVSVNGELYGTTEYGGYGQGDGCSCGTIFKITKGGLKTIMYRFTGGADGLHPQGLTRDDEGNLYGAASLSLTQGVGTLFKFDPAGVFTVLYIFTGGADGGNPVGRLIRDTNGNIHGVAATGGDPTCDCGVVFQLDASGNETVLHKFLGGEGGLIPFSSLLDVDGVLYGTTYVGGDLACNAPNGGCGVLYQIGKTGQYTVLHRFAGPSSGDGANLCPEDNLQACPAGKLTLGMDGSIYGATWFGGTGGCGGFGCGVIFKYTP
jgi:uncharacterized repeat protein (TIGR03803 family)